MIVVTGASGFVGSQIVEGLRACDELLLVGRNPEQTRQKYPGLDYCSYADLNERSLKGATVVHLAVRNNDQPGSLDEFTAANVTFLMEVARSARSAGAARFINLCSTHALAPGQGDAYGLSKQRGARELADFWPEGAINLYVPAIYGGQLQGRLGLLNGLPNFVRTPLLALLRQAKPMLAGSNLLQGILKLRTMQLDPSDRWDGERYLADPVPSSGLYAAIKRTIDLVGALVLLLLASWAMLIIALYVRLDSSGPALFAQKRVGRGGREFTCYKFRTMQLGTGNAATHEVAVSSVTRAGGFLRRTKLDELPQAWNVLCNHMSFVGPRPCLPVQAELIDRRERRGVLALKPGITGLAQVNDIDMSDPARLAACDDRYGAFRTTLSDFLLLLRTLKGAGSGDRVAGVEAR